MIETSDVSSKIQISSSGYYVYILQSLIDKGLYIGYTTDLKTRLIRHSSGKVFSTKLRRPFKLIHYEYFVSMKDAKARELFLKSGYGRDQLKQFMKNTFNSFK